MLRNCTRKVIILLLMVGSFGFYGWHFYAKQGGQNPGGFTQPPKPTNVKVEKTATSAADTEGAAFIPGEKLSYNVTWARFVTAARVEVEVIERGAFFGQEGYQLRTKVETAGNVRAIFFEMFNQYTAYSSLKTLLPYRVENSLRQGVKQTDESVIFDQASHEARFQDDATLALPGNTYDLTSLLFAVRQRPLAEGWKQTFNAIYGKQIIEVEVEVKKRERVQVQAGAYNTVKVEFNPKSKQFSKYRAQVWFSDDAQRLPIVMLGKLPFGDVRSELTNVTYTRRGNQPRLQAAPLVEAPEGSTVAGTNGHHQPGVPRNLPFDLGEKLNYDIAWGNFTSVGRASFEVRQKGYIGERRVYEFAAEANSTGAARAVININDQLISFVDAETLEPLKTDTRLREGRRTKFVAAEYDWASKKAKLPNGTQISLPPGTLDLLSLFYMVRAAELKEGTSFKYPFLDANHRVQWVVVRTVKTESISSPLGARDCFQLDVLTEDKTILLGQAWISNDARRLPLYIATRMRFGELRFQLATVVNPR